MRAASDGERRLAERVYDALIMLYPEEFRREYGQELSRSFADLHKETCYRGAVGAVKLWLRVLPDLFSTALAERTKIMGGAILRAGSLLTLKNMMLVNGVGLVVVGLAMFVNALWVLDLYNFSYQTSGSGAPATLEAHDGYLPQKLLGQTLGTMLLCFGVFVTVAASVAGELYGRALAGALLFANLLIALESLVNIVQYGSVAGWATIGLCLLLALCYGISMAPPASRVAAGLRSNGRPTGASQGGGEQR